MIDSLTRHKAVKTRLLRNHADIRRKNHMQEAEIGKPIFAAFFADIIFDASHRYGGLKKVL